MVCQWEPWTQYGHDAVVQYEGCFYKIIQPHRSEPNWQPTNTPALWSRVPDDCCHQYRSGENHHGGQEHNRPQFVDQSGGAPGGGYQERPQGGGWGQDNNGGNQLQENQGWLDEKRKHQLEIGGGILGAVAIGAGAYAYSKHKSEEKEEAKKQAWQNESNHETWLRGAHAHTQHYMSGGQSPPVYWVLVDRNDPIPNNAIEGGREGGHSLYIGRVFFKSGLHIGKVSSHVGGIAIGWGGKEHNDFDKFEVLCGDNRAIRWINHSSHQGNITVQGWQPVEGGREADGRFLFVSQVQHDGGVHPCKAQDTTDFAIFSYGGKEHTSKEFNILAYA
ncbi:carbohydrate-binding module family 12 [Phakopsora pachyrhizi]|nr:carbohydrate-binding module family 12 [Phakopsora pachyrhizi]